jgi:hypothetical protein
MELILMTISRIYEVQIKIFSNKSEYVNTITTLDYDEIIYLGHINEEHYIPVIELDADIAVEQLLMEEYMKSYPIYVSAKHKYHKWGNFCVNELNFYVQDNETIIATKKDNPIKNNDIKGIMSTINLDLSNDIKETENFNDFHVVI